MRIQGNKLKEARESERISLAELSEKSGICVEILQQMETDRYTPISNHDMWAILHALNKKDPCYIVDNTSSHSERDILDGCIALMQELTDSFREYLDYIDALPDKDDEGCWTSMSYFEIVQRLFLWNTSHSGGTSTGMKCAELGVDSSKRVRFSFYAEDEEDEDEE